MYKLLTDAQFSVLRWVAEGQPTDVYDEGFAHRITARALERRGLLKVSGQGISWTASLTPGGRFYIEHGYYEAAEQPDSPSSSLRQGTVPKGVVRPAVVDIDIEDLLARLRDTGGVLRIDSPSDVDRRSYRQAVEKVRGAAVLASDEIITMSGITRGPVIVELAHDIAEEPRNGVPDEVDPRDAAVRAARSKLADVSDAAKPRALAMIQAIAHECAARGWTCTFDEDAGFVISVGEDTYRCVLREEKEKRDRYLEADIAEQKYDWQRVTPTRVDVPTGRLRLEIQTGHRGQWWADRKRGSLASKMPEFFAALEEMSAAARERRARLAQAHRDNLELWEKAVPRARERHIHGLNVQRAHIQVAAWRQANELRAYADAIAASEKPIETGGDSGAADWVTWLRAEAERIDPLLNLGELSVETPQEISPVDLDKHMPSGWTTRHPPAPPTWLPL